VSVFVSVWKPAASTSTAGVVVRWKNRHSGRQHDGC